MSPTASRVTASFCLLTVFLLLLIVDYWLESDPGNKLSHAFEIPPKCPACIVRSRSNVAPRRLYINSSVMLTSPTFGAFKSDPMSNPFTALILIIAFPKSAGIYQKPVLRVLREHI